MSLDVAAVRADFPLLQRRINGKPLIYLDSANTSQKPQSVIDAMVDYYSLHNANVHRGSYQLAVEATEPSRRPRQGHVVHQRPRSARGAVHQERHRGLQPGRSDVGRANLGTGDAVVITELEHHANIVPWQMLAAEKGIELRWIPIDAEGQLDPQTSIACSMAPSS